MMTGQPEVRVSIFVTVARDEVLVRTYDNTGDDFDQRLSRPIREAAEALVRVADRMDQPEHG